MIGNAIEPVFTPDWAGRRGRLRARGRRRSSRARTSAGSPTAAARAGVELRVVGARGWGGVETPGWVGEVSDEELAALYRGARALVFPSLYEGFGIPVLEAMACGTPVVTSRGGATEEVAGARRCSSTRSTSRRSRPGSRRPRRAARSCARSASNVRGTYSWAAVADAVERVWRELA